MKRSSVRRVMQGSCPNVRCGGLSSCVCFWQVLAEWQWTAMQLSAKYVFQQNPSLLATREEVQGRSRLCCTRLCVNATFVHGNLVLHAVQTDTGSGMGVSPAARTSDGRCSVCLLCDGLLACPLVWYAPAAGRDPGHGCATRQRSHRIFQAFPTFERHQHFWACGNTVINLGSRCSMLFKASRSYFQWTACL